MSFGGDRGGGRGSGFLDYGLLTPVVKGVAAGIGLASESIHHHRERKTAEKAASLSRENSDPGTLSPPPPYEDKSYESKTATFSTHQKHPEYENVDIEAGDGDEEHWDLDEAQQEIIDVEEEHTPTPKRPRESDPKKIVMHFVNAYPVSSSGPTGSRLSLPVILPQRRPKTRARGFIRAYAPELGKCGIDQAMFIDFLDTFNLATLASPWLDAINLASFAFMALPSAIGQAASIAVAIAVEIAKNMQSRHRYNNVLDQMNNEFYRPRGLYALMLTWNPDFDDANVGININETISQNMTAPEGVMQKTKHSLRPSMANTSGVVFTEAAPLVFPELESLADVKLQDPTKTKSQKEKLIRAKGLAADYFDRRAQASFAGENPGSHLDVGPKPKFTSRYSDPNHPSNSGSLISLLTGGKVNLPPRAQMIWGSRSRLIGRGMSRSEWVSGRAHPLGLADGRGMAATGDLDATGHERQQEYEQYQYQMDGYEKTTRPNYGFQGPRASVGQGIHRIIRRHVLYLTIVNMPSDKELAEASRILKHAQAKAHAQEEV